MCKIEDGIARYAPLCIHSFRLIAPRKLLEAQLFNRQYHSFDEITNVPERLRWLRHQKGWMQKEVAELLEIPRTKYIEYEVGSVKHYPKEIVDKLAALYRVSVDDLLDDYNRFLYYGQGRLIKEYRENHGLNKKQFARQLQIDPGTIRIWENEEKRMIKDSWEKYFRDIIVI